MSRFNSDSILVLLDVTPSGELAKSSAGLLGAASALGTPVALVVAAEDAAPTLAKAAADAGATISLVADACAGSTPENQAAALAVMGLYPPQITVTTTDAVLR